MNKTNGGKQILFVFVVLHPDYQTLISPQSPLLLLPVAITLSESTHRSSSDEPLFLASNLLVVVGISSVFILHYHFVQHTEQNFGSRSGKKKHFQTPLLWLGIYSHSFKDFLQDNHIIIVCLSMKCKTSTQSSMAACSSSGILELSQPCVTERGKGKATLLLRAEPESSRWSLLGC